MSHLIVLPGQGKNYDWSNDHIYVKTPDTFTGGRVTLVEDALKPGFHLPRHHHKLMVEIFYILEGEVVFAFDDETVVAVPGMTLNIPPHVWHGVRCEKGGKLLTIFSPGGFDRYLNEIALLSEAQWADESVMTSLAQQYDTWMA